MNALFSGTIAYEQVLMLLGGFLCLGIGGFVLANEAYWRRRALRVAGIISGVRRRQQFFYPVYRYQLPSGEIIESTGDIGRAAPRNMETGRMVPLMVLPDAPQAARPVDSLVFPVVAAVLIIPGLLLVCFAMTNYPATRATWFMLSVFALYVILQLNRISARGRAGTPDWQAALKRKHEAEMRDVPIQRAEDFLTAEGQPLPGRPQGSRIAAHAFLLIGALAVLSGAHKGNSLRELLDHGRTAEGRIVEMRPAADRRSGYQAVVRFPGADGKDVTFTDSESQDPPVFKEGEAVGVIYLPRDPGHTAIIDRGLGNWGLSPVFISLGTVLIALGGHILRRTDGKPGKGKG